MNYSFLLRSFEVKRPGAIVVAVFCQTFSIFAVFDGGDLLPGSSAINLLPLMLGVFLLRSEACFAEVVFSLAPEFVQVFFEGRRPFWPLF